VSAGHLVAALPRSYAALSLTGTPLPLITVVAMSRRTRRLRAPFILERHVTRLRRRVHVRLDESRTAVARLCGVLQKARCRPVSPFDLGLEHRRTRQSVREVELVLQRLGSSGGRPRADDHVFFSTAFMILKTVFRSSCDRSAASHRLQEKVLAAHYGRGPIEWREEHIGQGVRGIHGR